MERAAAIDRLERVVETVESDRLPVPVREVWTFGDVALGLDPVERLDVYVTKDVLLRDDAPGRAAEFEERFGVKGIGRTVRADWAEANPERVRANDAGHAAPERCLAAHLLPADEPAHLEVCNTSFTDNVTQRLRGAIGSGSHEQALDPRGVCLWAEGERSETAFSKLRDSAFAFPTLREALEMIGAEAAEAEAVAAAIRDHRGEQSGRSVRGDVV